MAQKPVWNKDGINISILNTHFNQNKQAVASCQSGETFSDVGLQLLDDGAARAPKLPDWLLALLFAALGVMIDPWCLQLLLGNAIQRDSQPGADRSSHEHSLVFSRAEWNTDGAFGAPNLNGVRKREKQAGNAS